MSCWFFVVKFKTLIVTLLIILMLIYIAYVGYSVFFVKQAGSFVLNVLFHMV